MDLKTARDTVFGMLTADDEGTPDGTLTDWIGRVWPGEPGAGRLTKPGCITVSSLGGGGMDPTTITVVVRLYIDPNSDVLAAQDSLDDAIEATERLLDDSADSSLFIRGQWSPDYDDALDMLVAPCALTCSRTDY